MVRSLCVLLSVIFFVSSVSAQNHPFRYRIIIPVVYDLEKDDLEERLKDAEKVLEYYRLQIDITLQIFNLTLNFHQFQEVQPVEHYTDQIFYPLSKQLINETNLSHAIGNFEEPSIRKIYQWMDLHESPSIKNLIESVYNVEIKSPDVLTIIGTEVTKRTLEFLVDFQNGLAPDFEEYTHAAGVAYPTLGYLSFALGTFQAFSDQTFQYRPFPASLLLHEIMHMLGLSHVRDPENLMHPSGHSQYNLTLEQIKAAAAVIYGEPITRVPFLNDGDAFINIHSKPSIDKFGYCGDGMIGDFEDGSMEECDTQLTSVTVPFNPIPRIFCVDPTTPVPQLNMQKACVACKCVDIPQDPSQSSLPVMKGIVLPIDDLIDPDGDKSGQASTPFSGPVPPGSGGACDPTQVGINAGCTVDIDCNNGIGQRCNSDCRCECLSGLPPCAGDDECILGQPFAISCDPLTGCCADAVIFEG